MRSTLPANIGSLNPAGAAYESLQPVKSLALRRAIVHIDIYIYIYIYYKKNYKKKTC